MRIATIPVLIFALLSVSCSQTPPPPPPAKQPTVFDAQLKALDKAKAVQDIVDKQKKDMDKKLEDAGG
jgi:hypothetical protein